MDNYNIRYIFITGATGFLASGLLKTFLTKNENQIYVLVRAKDNTSALQRKESLINETFAGSMRRRATSRIHLVKGNISKADLGLSKEDLQKLQRTVDTIYHCAAICDFSYNLKAIREVNVKGTENLLKLALDWQNKGNLENVNHISTVYIAGNYRGRFHEEQLHVSQGFNNTYEQTKYEAELVVQKYRKKGLRVDIYRPSIITDTVPPSRDAIPGLLQLLAVFVLEIFKKIPADSNTMLNMIPVDVVSQAIYLISTTKNRPMNQNYHIVHPKPVMLGALLDTASEYLLFKKPICVPAAEFRMQELSLIQRKIIESFIPYLNQKMSFDSKNAASILKRYNFNIPSINKKGLINTLKHYKSAGLIPKKEILCY